MKNNNILKVTMWILSLIHAAFTLLVYNSLPEIMPMHYDASGTVDRWGNKSELFVIVGVFLMVMLYITVQIRGFENKAEKTDDEKARAGYKNNAKVTTVVGLVSSAFMAVIYVFINLEGMRIANEGTNVISMDVSRILCIGLGIMFIVLGNYMPKTRINSIVGVRCAWTRYNDVTWSKSNRFASYLIVAVGALAIVLAFALPNAMHALIITSILTLLTGVLSTIYAYRIYKEESNSGKEQD